MQKGLSKIGTWCKSKELSVNPEKTEAVLFIGRRKTEEIVGFEYQGVKLTLTKEVKYLGVIFDEKLM